MDRGRKTSEKPGKEEGLVEEEEEETPRDSYVAKVCVLWVQ